MTDKLDPATLEAAAKASQNYLEQHGFVANGLLFPGITDAIRALGSQDDQKYEQIEAGGCAPAILASTPVNKPAPEDEISEGEKEQLANLNGGY